jgi:hypothetical protein
MSRPGVALRCQDSCSLVLGTGLRPATGVLVCGPLALPEDDAGCRAFARRGRVVGEFNVILLPCGGD